MLTDFPGDSVVPQFYKISGPFKRQTEKGPDHNKLKIGEWYDSAFDTLQNAQWNWTEKLDGTNVRVHWDGHRVSMAGRTDRAQLHGDLTGYIQDTFTEELFEQAFGSTPVTLFGEGVGPGIQKGGELYGDVKHFRLFEVKMDNVWRTRLTVVDVAAAFGVEPAELFMTGTVWEAIDVVKCGLLVDHGFGKFLSEGLVGVPVDGFLNYNGTRIAMKVKTCDLYEANK